MFLLVAAFFLYLKYKKIQCWICEKKFPLMHVKLIPNPDSYSQTVAVCQNCHKLWHIKTKSLDEHKIHDLSKTQTKK